MSMLLHALADDFGLRSNDGLLRSTEPTDLLFEYYLTDPDGNRLTDPQGNYLIGYHEQTLYAQVLSALPDDFNLHAE